MADTHDYPVRIIKAKELTPSHVIVGESGGLSAVYGVTEDPRSTGTLLVKTEHGFLSMDVDHAVTVYSIKRTPDEICRDLADGIMGRSDVDVKEVIDELVEDLLDSMGLAISNAPEVMVIDDVVQTVRDYYANHYGEL